MAAREAKWALAIGMLLVVAFGYKVPLSLFYQNLGWLDFAQGQLETRADLLAQAQVDFARSLVWNQHNSNSWRGQAMVAALQENKQLTFTSWPQAKLTPEEIIGYGSILVGPHRVAASLLTFQSAIALFSVVPNQATDAAARVCQYHWADLEVYSTEVAAYCHQILAENDNNLLFNSQFTDGTELAWNGQFFFTKQYSAELIWVNGEGIPQPAAAITGKVEGPHYGIFQRICLLPGTKVSFSGWFRVRPNGPFLARLLYFSWLQHGLPQGSQAQSINQPLEWTYFEREFVFPADGVSHVDFYPVDVAGIGTVWFDNLRLEIIPPSPTRSTMESMCSK